MLQLGAAQDASEVRDGLDRLVRSLRGKVADDLCAKVVSIQGSILATLETEGAAGDAADPNVYLIRQTALAYLPDAFSTYLRMPRLMAERRAIAGGRTPHDVLLDQLDLMDRRLADVADDIARHDSDKLLANGRFLAEKFGVSALQLDTRRQHRRAAPRSPPARRPSRSARRVRRRSGRGAGRGRGSRPSASASADGGRPPNELPVGQPPGSTSRSTGSSATSTS